MMNWIKILSLEQIEQHVMVNKPVSILLHQTPLAIVWDGNTYFAFKNVCPHNKARLSDGKLNAFGEIICPWHEYRYNIKTGRECANRTADLATFTIEKRADGLYLFI